MIDRDVLLWASGLISGLCRQAEIYPFLSLRFTDEGLLTVESAWRLVREEKIVVASSHPSALEIVSALEAHIVGSKVLWLDVKGAFNDLVIGFESGVRLETFDDSSQFEHWQISGPPDLSGPRMLVAGPGELWSGFGSPPAPA